MSHSLEDMNRKFPDMQFNSNYVPPQKLLPPPAAAHMFQPVNRMPGPPQMMAPNMMPIPMMPMRQLTAEELEYSRWMAESYSCAAYSNPQQQMYDHQGYMSPHHQMPHSYSRQSNNSSQRHYSRGADRDHSKGAASGMHSEHNSSLPQISQISTSRSPTPPSVELCGSPRFGPGPPIVTSERVKGPRGCNLFVFHLPNEITNWDMYLLFRRFGTILSVHTMVNKATGLSKGYGFVSYSAAPEAHAAISEMDGFRLGKKRLKVQLKRSQDDGDDMDGDFEDDGDVFYPARDLPSATRPVPIARRDSQETSTSGTTTRASSPREGGSRPHDSAEDFGHFDGVDSTSPQSDSLRVDSGESVRSDKSATGVADLFGKLSVKTSTSPPLLTTALPGAALAAAAAQNRVRDDGRGEEGPK